MTALEWIIVALIVGFSAGYILNPVIGKAFADAPKGAVKGRTRRKKPRVSGGRVRA